MPESRIDSAKVLVLCKAAAATRGGAWVYGAPTHVFAEFLSALERDGWTLARGGTEDELREALRALANWVEYGRDLTPEAAQERIGRARAALAARAASTPEEGVDAVIEGAAKRIEGYAAEMERYGGLAAASPYGIARAALGVARAASTGDDAA